MTFQFTKYSLVNALLSLIPIFPIWTLFPIIGIESGIENYTGDCILSYKITLGICMLLIAVSIIVYLFSIKKILLKEPKVIKRNFRWFSLLIYTFINCSGLIIILGPYLACNGSSMSIMVCIFSGPIASVVLIILGLLIDLKVKQISSNKL
ncbi:hypothetical protein SAMN05216490_4202 [Mucilaginibacter mallensis]|uniref:Uncharacterized protein n=1 Tax=Mucilaginibacter mallensis TaxID=652787 RepID=A0A1H2BLP9_MUCMA|nr:hypothetical protein SAMN05216490_4202 [Mucilaginibacter mallensis]